MKRLIILSVALVALLASCVEENISHDTTLRLTFSSDTIMFDTLFVGQSSTTKTFMIYNHNRNALSITSIRLGGGDASRFRFNIDGRIAAPGETLGDITIKGRDSLYCFVEYLPDTPSDDAPFSLAADSLLFECNTVRSSVQLIGIGRDAVILDNLTLTTDTTLTPRLPYLVFGTLHIPERTTLTIAAGTTLYMHDRADILVDGTLHIDGTPDAPVTIRGDRYDHINDADRTPYDQMPNQWGGILLQSPTAAHRITDARIRGMSSGILLVGTHSGGQSLRIANSVIHNSGVYGIYNQMSDLQIVNTEISNCGESCLLALGGNTHLIHTTIANYYRFASRRTASLRILNVAYQNGVPQLFPVSSFISENSIIFGQNTEELELLADSTATFNTLFSHTLIKGERQTSPRFLNCLWARSRNHPNALDTVFRCTTVANIAETGYYNFRLDSLSFARNSAHAPLSALYPLDLDATPRPAHSDTPPSPSHPATAPDLGAYEFHSPH